MKINDINFLFSRSPSYLVFHVTSRCNFDCAHCFTEKIKTRDTDELTLDEISRVSRHLGHIKYLTLAGGEPMLRSDLKDIAGLFYHNNGLHILNIVTNGWFHDRIVSCVKSLLKEYPLLKINVGVSVDGPEAIHDKFRCRPGSYARALNTVLSLKALAADNNHKRLFIMVNGTYHAGNCNNIIPAATFFSKEIGVPYYVGLIRGNVREPELKDLEIDHFRQTQKEIQKLLQLALPRHYPFRVLRLAVDNAVTDIIYNSYKSDKCLVKCRAGTKGIMIKADGEMPLCEMLDITLGNVRDFDYDPMVIRKREQSLQAVKKITDKKCHCTWECFQRLNVVFSPQLYPRLVINALNKLY